MRVLRDLVDELLKAKVTAKLFGGDHAPKLGRLVLLDRIGAGAMGTVFAAYDPRLDRKVAVKVLQTSDSAVRVLDEARALAKLAHPNVVAVHDADELDGLVYIVMELAPGVPLRTWIGGHHGWRDVVRVMREAGTGIAAAHAAGLVHRDIKPDNILVGEDRARVVDFGLAHASADDEGSSAGTPFYMAPEVLAGQAATQASDQFSYAVTLYEALYGQRPHGALAATIADTVPAAPTVRDVPVNAITEPTRGASLVSRRELIEDLRQAAATAASTPRPANTQVPSWVHATVTRALAREPSDRHPTMAELVAALGRDRRRGRVIAISAAALACGAVLGAVAYRSQSGGDPCAGGPVRISNVWSDAVKTRVRSSLAAAPWLKHTLDALDDKALHWQTSFRRVCEATRVHGDQSDSLLDLRMRCLERALDRFGALTTTITTGLDAPARIAAPGAVSELPEAAVCETLTDPGDLAMPTDAGDRARARALELDVDRAWAAYVLGRYQDARTMMATIETATASIAAPRLRAEALALSSSIEARVGAGDKARAKLDEALLAAADAKAPELEADVWSRRLRNELFAGDPAKVIEWANFARAAARRAGREGAAIDGIVAQALRTAGKLGEARDLLDRALATKDPLRPDQLALLEMNRGSVDLAAGNSAAALVWFQRAYDRVLAAVGDHHPDLSIHIDKLAAAQRARGKLRDALELHDRSLALRIAAFGPDDRSVATGYFYRAQTQLEAGELEPAAKDLESARAIREKSYGPDSPRLGEIIAARGELEAAQNPPINPKDTYDRAAALDPRLDLMARRFEAGIAVALDLIPALDPAETLSVERAGALAVRVALLAAATRTDEAAELAKALHTRLLPDLDPAFAYAIGSALAHAGNRAGAEEVFSAAAGKLGNEPTRTALRIFIGLARASDTNAAAAARAAIALHQAMPNVERTAHDEMWAITRR